MPKTALTLENLLEVLGVNDEGVTFPVSAVHDPRFRLVIGPNRGTTAIDLSPSCTDAIPVKDFTNGIEGLIIALTHLFRTIRHSFLDHNPYRAEIVTRLDFLYSPQISDRQFAALLTLGMEYGENVFLRSGMTMSSDNYVRGIVLLSLLGKPIPKEITRFDTEGRLFNSSTLTPYEYLHAVYRSIQGNVPFHRDIRFNLKSLPTDIIADLCTYITRSGRDIVEFGFQLAGHGGHRSDDIDGFQEWVVGSRPQRPLQRTA